MSGHAFLPPSGASSWVACAAWPTMNQLFPQDDTPESVEGTGAHWVFVELFYQRPVLTGAITSNGVPVTEEMQIGADLYVFTIDADLARDGLDRRYLRVEQRVAIPHISPHNWGTPDTWYYAPHLHTIRVYDYKFGHGFVDAFEMWQCVDYLAGIIEELAGQYGRGVGDFEQGLTVEIIVVQPRNYDRDGPVRRWSVPATHLRAMWNKLADAALRALEQPPLETPGPHCDHCPGSHACNTLQRQGYRAVQISRASVPAVLPTPALGTELTMLREAARFLKARIDGLEVDAFARLRRGENVPGFAVEERFGREGWKVPPLQVIATGSVLGVDVSKPGVLTPKQAIAAGMPDALVASLSTKESKGLALVVDSGQRAAKAFGKTS